MHDPRRAGALIYATHMERLAGFYASILDMDRQHAVADHIVLSNSDFQLIIHAIPALYANEINITTPPLVREETPIKLFFTVNSLAHAKDKAARLGGSLFEAEWQGPGFRARNGYDPEGNVFQLREPSTG